MTRNIRKTGSVLLGLLLVSLLAVSAQADVVRTADQQQDNLIELFTVTGTIAPGATTVTLDIVYANGFSASDFDFGPSALVVKGTVAQNALASWFTDSGKYDSFVGYWDDADGILRINDDVLAGSGNWFYNLEFAHEYWGFDEALMLDFGTASNYVFTLYAVEADVPEPATFALVGLGIAGLGLVRRRK